MAFNINDFLLQNNNDWARADKFDVSIPIPPVVVPTIPARTLALQCYATNLPGLEVSTIDYKTNVLVKRIPQKVVYAPIQLSFYVTGDMLIRSVFDAWITAMINPDFTVKYKTNAGIPQYESQILIQQYDLFGNKSYSVTLDQAFPTLISDMPLDWKEDAVHRLTVTFVYYQWFSNYTSSLGISGGSGNGTTANPTPISFNPLGGVNSNLVNV